MSLSIIYSVICIPYSIRSFMKEEKNGNHYYAWYLCKYCTRTVYICVATRRLSHLCIHKLLGTNNCKHSNRLTRVVRCNPNANWLLATYLTKSTKTKDSLPPMCHYIMPTVKSAREDVLYYTYCIFFFFGRSFNPNAQVTASFVSISVYCASCALYSSFFLS